MNVLVCAKQVPDAADVQMNEDLTLRREATAQVMNPADESALEKALCLRDALGGRVTVMSMGKPCAEGMLREALSRGADEAVLLTDGLFAGSDTLATARALAAAIRFLGGFELIVCGRRASDGETGQVPPMIASLLDIPCVANATEVWVDNGQLLADQLTEKGTLRWRVALPAMVTLCEWSHALRLPSLLGLRRAKNAEVRVLSAGEIGLRPEECGFAGSPTRVVRASARAAGARACVKLTAEELLRGDVWRALTGGDAP